jgi:hypothetical protein
MLQMFGMAAPETAIATHGARITSRPYPQLQLFRHATAGFCYTIGSFYCMQVASEIWQIMLNQR